MKLRLPAGHKDKKKLRVLLGKAKKNKTLNEIDAFLKPRSAVYAYPPTRD